MKRLALLSLAVLASIALANNASALSFSVDVPYQFTFDKGYFAEKKQAKIDQSTVDDVGGFILGTSFGWFGVGYEKYDVNGVSKPAPGIVLKAKQSYQIYDVYVDLPMPWLNVALGYGKGQMNTAFDTAPAPRPKIDPTDVSQVFARVGWPIGKIFDLHLGYSAVTAEDATIHNPPPGTGPKKWIGGSGKLVSAGVRAGW